MVHVRFNGRSFDLSQQRMGISSRMSDQEIQQAVANFLEVPATEMSNYVVDRRPKGDLIIRPEAVYG